MSLSLSITALRKAYGQREVLSGCGAAFSGGITVLMGPNGAGKSTLLRLCALLEPPTSGSVVYSEGGRALPPGMSLMRRITLVPPRAGIFNTSVIKNAAYGLRVRGVPRAEARERARAILERVGLSDRWRQNALSLSSGEAQRLALARAMLVGPEVVFLDEPTASVDEENREIIESLILRLRGNGGPTILLTTHDRAQAERLADRLLLLERGLLREAGK